MISEKRENGFYWADVEWIPGGNGREVVEYRDGVFLVSGISDMNLCNVKNVSNERIVEKK